MTSDKQSKSQSARQNSKPEGTQRTLTDSDIEELISFFRLLDEWDREAQAKVASDEAG